MDIISAQTMEPKPKAPKVPFFTLIARIVSIVTLVVSIAILKGNNFADNPAITAFYYNAIGSYKYMFGCALLGIGYNILQTPFAAYYARRRKRMVNHNCFLLFEFYADKAISYILGTAVGAAFGVTKDFKYMNRSNTDIHKSDFDHFFNMNYLASGFLFVGFICSIALSMFSSCPCFS